MNPSFSGFSLIVSVVIIVFGFVFTRLHSYVPWLGIRTQRSSPFVRALIGFFVVLMLGFVSIGMFSFVTFHALGHEDNNAEVLRSTFVECTPIVENASNDNLIILRLDDVQAYGWADISMKMIEEANNRNMPVVAGVIAKNIRSNKRMVRFLKEHLCNIEIALHGYDHAADDKYIRESGAFAEFGQLTYEEAESRIRKSRHALRGLDANKLITFIPPENMVSDEAARALYDYGFRYISSGSHETYDFHAATWNYMDNSYIPSAYTMKDCEDKFDKGEKLCVIMLHPQDYANSDNSLDTEQFNDFLWLLDDIARKDIRVVRFQDLDNDTELNSWNHSKRHPRRNIRISNVNANDSLTEHDTAVGG